MRELGQALERAEFRAEALDGRIAATYDGLQQLKALDIAEDALAAADKGGGAADLAEALLAVLREAHQSSQTTSQQDVWQLYKEHGELLQAPRVQLGPGELAEDPWAQVESTEETRGLAAELFDAFDGDRDGYWNFKETSEVQLATEGTDMSEDAFNSLILAAADNKGRDLVEEDLARGLSREQVIDLYTNAERQRSLGFLLDIYKDHAAAFAADPNQDKAPGEERLSAAGAREEGR